MANNEKTQEATQEHEKHSKTVQQQQNEKKQQLDTRKQAQKETRNQQRKQDKKEQQKSSGEAQHKEPMKKDIEKGLEQALDTVENRMVQRLDQTTLTINGLKYEIVKDYRDAFDSERLEERYSPILDKYDYIVADWGYDKLRLKGFYHNQNRKVPQDKKIGQLEDYLYEYCNFGAPYFVLERTEPLRKKTSGSSKKHRKQKSKNPTNKKRPNNRDFEKTRDNRKKTSGHPEGGTRPSHKTKTSAQKSSLDFVQKEVPQKKAVEKEQETVIVKTVKDQKGTRRFNIRRKDMDRAKNRQD